MDLTRNGGALIFRGILAIIFGVLAFIWPGITLEVLVFLFGAYAFVDGIFAFAAASAGGTRGRPWGALLIEGLIGIGAGIVTFFWPGITAVALLYVIAFWAIATGVFEVIAAVHLRRHIAGEWALGLSGVLSILFGLALVISPVAGALAVVWLIGAYALVFGILLTALGIRLRTGRYFPGARAGRAL